VKERLQKILARAGYGSRRSAEALITGGRVRVNGQVVTQLGSGADLVVDRISVDGTELSIEPEHAYLMMNKPAGVVTTARDPQRRPTVMSLLPGGLPPHVLPVGRLDLDTEGLLLFTNDGELAHRLTHPRFEVGKEYHALVRGRPSERTLSALQRGVNIGDVVVSASEAAFASAPPGHAAPQDATWVRLVIHEGRKRQVRLMFSKLGHPVRELIRTRIGEVRLGRLTAGDVRTLTPSELRALRRSVGLLPDSGKPVHSRR
jgi:pseudouridine synthase